jgi:hypothetical protein
MNTLNPSHQDLVEIVNNLPAEVLPELAHYLHYLQFRVETPILPETSQSGSEFLLSIAGIGEAEADLSERDYRKYRLGNNDPL